MKKVWLILCLPLLLSACSAPQAKTSPASVASVQEQSLAGPTVDMDDAPTGEGQSPMPAALESAGISPVAASLAAGTVMSLQSAGIENGILDPKYGMHGDKKVNGVPVLSPPLEIRDAPEGAKCFAVMMDDPDARGFVHWMAVNIKEHNIPEDFSRTVGSGAVQGRNDFGTVGYGGPTPPDKDHTYSIRIYALDSTIDLQPGFSKDEFQEALKGHILASAELKAVYKK